MDLEERPLASIGSCATFFGNRLILFSAMAMPLRSSHLGMSVLPSTKWEPLLKPMFWTQEAILVVRRRGVSACWFRVRRSAACLLGRSGGVL